MAETQEKTRALHTVLERVEPGRVEDVDEYARRGRKEQLPAGITNKDMYRDIIGIAWPSFIELTLTQLASMVDMMMVGQLGAWALTAVGLTAQPKFLLATLFMSMNVGATAMVARHKGAGNPDRANLVVRQALLMTFTFSLVMSVIGFIFAPQMVMFMGAKEPAVLNGAVGYLRVQMAGFMSMALTTTITAVLRGVGDSRTAMRYNLVANLSNVLFNWLLIYGNLGMPRLEVVGASLATVMGQVLAMCMAIYAITKKGGYLRVRLKDGFKPHMDEMSNIFAIGIPSMIEQLFMRAGMIVYTKTVANLGTVAYATHQVCMNIQALSFMNGQAFSISATSLVGQSLGKKRPDMAKSYANRTRTLGFTVSVGIAIVCFFFGGNIVGLYNNDPAIVTVGSRLMMMVALVQPLQAAQFIISGSLRGAGDTKATAAIVFVTTLFVRPALAIVLINYTSLGLYGAWIALVVDQALRSLLITMRYNSGKWMYHRFK